MSAPVAGTIILPTDSGNTGKLLRTETKVISATTVHEHFFRPVMAVTLTGRYWFSSAQKAVVIAASSPQNGTSTGSFWLQNPVASTVTGVLRRIVFDSNCSAANVMATAAMISVTKFTFSGTASGASVANLPSKTGGTASQIIVQTAATGMTVALVSDVAQFQVPAVESTGGAVWGAKEAYPFNPLAFGRGPDLEIAPGEGLVVYQSQAGTATTDSRVWSIQITWDEIDLS